MTFVNIFCNFCCVFLHLSVKFIREALTIINIISCYSITVYKKFIEIIGKK